MQYTIIYEGKVFFTKWFEAENHFAEGMVIIDLASSTYTNDGKNWQEIEEDHL